MHKADIWDCCNAQALAAQLALDAARAYNALAALVPALPFDGDPASVLGMSNTLCCQSVIATSHAAYHLGEGSDFADLHAAGLLFTDFAE